MKKSFLPKPIIWPDFSGPMHRQQDLEELKTGDYLAVTDRDGITGLRMDRIRTNNYDMTVLHPSGFKENIRLPRPTTLTVRDRLTDIDGKFLFSFIPFLPNMQEMHVFTKGTPFINNIESIFDQERPCFNLGQRKSKRVTRISISTWPKNEPIFIVDRCQRHCILFLQEFCLSRPCRCLLQFYRSAATNKICKRVYYSSFRSFVEEDRYLGLKEKELDKNYDACIYISNMRVYS
jgi:hypothetical protein